MAPRLPIFSLFLALVCLVHGNNGATQAGGGNTTAELPATASVSTSPGAETSTIPPTADTPSPAMLTVRRHPENMDLYRVDDGQPVVFACVYTGAVTGDVKWTGPRVPETAVTTVKANGTTVSILVLPVTTLQDAGRYQCSASASADVNAATATIKFYLIVTAKLSLATEVLIGIGLGSGVLLLVIALLVLKYRNSKWRGVMEPTKSRMSFDTVAYGRRNRDSTTTDLDSYFGGWPSVKRRASGDKDLEEEVPRPCKAHNQSVVTIGSQIPDVMVHLESETELDACPMPTSTSIINNTPAEGGQSWMAGDNGNFHLSGVELRTRMAESSTASVTRIRPVTPTIHEPPDAGHGPGDHKEWVCPTGSWVQKPMLPSMSMESLRTVEAESEYLESSDIKMAVKIMTGAAVEETDYAIVEPRKVLPALSTSNSRPHSAEQSPTSPLPYPRSLSKNLRSTANEGVPVGRSHSHRFVTKAEGGQLAADLRPSRNALRQGGGSLTAKRSLPSLNADVHGNSHCPDSTHVTAGRNIPL
ncbi:uncharacterized protein LOC135819236 isoform X1 [Sycon ciliatum]|uniref:uncharacterized protein LOC135819236 isoform X1 n=1 Tax=Sycon ciliatum TaxID=27933 RepID=UPI0031F6B748